VSASRPAAVLFDNDGLTLASEICWTRAEEALWTRHGRTFTPQDKEALLGSATDRAARILETRLEQPGRGFALLDELNDLMLDELDVVEPMPGAVDLLEALRAAGIPVGMATNTPRALADRALRASGVGALFDHVIAGDEVSSPKPAPEIYVRLAGALGVHPADTVVLEDSPTGLAAGRAAGAFVVGVPSLPDLELDAHLVVPTLADPRLWARLGLSV
jgi:HAD superfamily hydrolase (TIGR01509 family)